MDEQPAGRHPALTRAGRSGWAFHPALAPWIVPREPGNPAFGLVARVLARRAARRALWRDTSARAREERLDADLLAYALPPWVQARALLFAPSAPVSCAFDRLFAALEAGERVDVVAIGGSVTTGLTWGITSGNWTYHHKVEAWLRASWPRADVRAHNLAVAGACAADLEPCIGDAGLPARTRLVLLESAANLFSTPVPSASAQDAATADLERLVRKVLLAGVALVELATPMFWADPAARPPANERVPRDRLDKQWPRTLDSAPNHTALTPYEAAFERGAAAPEGRIAQVCCHYGVPAALQRGAYAASLGIGSAEVARLVAARCEADARAPPRAQTSPAEPHWPPPVHSERGTLALLSLMRDRIHPTEHGHAHAAQLVVRALQRALAAYLLRAARGRGGGGGGGGGARACARHGVRADGSAGAPLPPPLFAGNFATRATCARGQGLRALVEAHGPPAELATRGFRWEVETDAAGRNPKAGYVGRGEGDLLALPFILPLPSSGGADEADASHAAAGGLGLDRPTGDRPTGDRPTGERADAARADAAQARPPLGKAMVGLLRSWASGMGVAAVSCHGSCTCARCERAQSG
ncbi:hypothetical protein KFE25_000377 [Diacronema lutheri]|uniref:SGNH hydrolase-type esterase domain-containing protein n=1 Tax=Diacronema lutheri TaxID=2081491 RepID=A0A8J6CDG1_DIALT|nr:hypothetical protein KFE25_000377 [Diacronema lutheri]